ncbi:hypothetical protein [Streptomyces sp. WAC 04229]
MHILVPLLAPATMGRVWAPIYGSMKPEEVAAGMLQKSKEFA